MNKLTDKKILAAVDRYLADEGEMPAGDGFWHPHWDPCGFKEIMNGVCAQLCLPFCVEWNMEDGEIKMDALTVIKDYWVEAVNGLPWESNTGCAKDFCNLVHYLDAEVRRCRRALAPQRSRNGRITFRKEAA